VSNPYEILEELKELSGSGKKQKKVAMAISSLLDEKVDEKVTLVKQELNEKYGKLVDEKSKLAALGGISDLAALAGVNVGGQGSPAAGATTLPVLSLTFQCPP